MESRTRPIGVTVLSVLAFAASPQLFILLVFLIYRIFTQAIPPKFNEDPGAFLWLSVWVGILSTCFLALAWVSYRAGLDLWNLKRQGLLLAVFTMLVFLLTGIAFLLIPGLFWKLLGAAVSVLSLFFLLYLRVPAIERRFDPHPQKARR